MTDLNFAKSRLQSALASGRTSAGNVIRNILSTTPTDEVVAAEHTSVRVFQGTVVETSDGRRNGYRVTAPSRVEYFTPGHELGMAGAPTTDYSFGQLLGKAGVPVAYGRSLLDADPVGGWQGDLLAHTINVHLSNSDDRLLVRSVGGTVRGILSDKFKRMDSRPMLDAFIKAAKDVGAEPVSGHATDTRVAVRALIPTIYEPVPGEAVAFGLHWGNSDFGNGSYHVTAFMLRLACLNGMVGEKALRKTHVGARLEEGAEFSKRTHQLTERALASATTDVVRAALGADAIAARVDAIRAMHSQEVDFKTAWERVGKSLTKGDHDAAKAVFESPDVVNVPAGKTMWRFANALSWVANGDDVSEEHRLDLQAVAGKLG